MKTPFHSPSSSAYSCSLFLAAIITLGAGHAFAAGDAAATSMYVTIQPDAANTGYIYTMSWVAPDTDNGVGVGVTTYTNAATSNPYGNATAATDSVTDLWGGNYVVGAQNIRYRAQAANTALPHVIYEDSPANTSTFAQWTDPINTTVGAVNPTTTTPKFDEIGNFTYQGNLIYGSGYQGITGVFSANPNGTGAATGSGVGFYSDDDGTGAVDSLGPLLSGFDDVQDPTKTNPFPNKGYVQVFVPKPTTGFTIDWFTERFIPGTYTNNASVELVVTTSSSYVPKLAISGDMDSDQDVDAADLTSAVTGYAGAGGTGKWYANGDMNADNDVDNADLGYVIGAFTPSSSSGSATLTYDPLTGNVKLNAAAAAGGKITSFQLEKATAASNIVSGSYTGPAFPGSYENITTSVIGDTDTTLAGFTGVADLGNVFPTGLDLAGLTAYLKTRVYTGESGSGQQQLTLALASGGNTDPTISDIANQTVASGGNTGALPVTVGDAETAVGSLSLSVTANSNPTLVPNGNIVFGGSDASRTVTVTPVSGLSGTATITIRVTDGGGLFAEDTFVLTVADNFLSWATLNSVTGGTNGDSDNDGVGNLVEYALVDGGERGVLSGDTITFNKRGGVYGADLTYIIETSETLASDSWTDEVTHGPVLLSSNPTISYTFTPGTPVKKFARLKVVKTP